MPGRRVRLAERGETMEEVQPGYPTVQFVKAHGPTMYSREMEPLAEDLHMGAGCALPGWLVPLAKFAGFFDPHSIFFLPVPVVIPAGTPLPDWIRTRVRKSLTEDQARAMARSCPQCTCEHCRTVRSYAQTPHIPPHPER